MELSRADVHAFVDGLYPGVVARYDLTPFLSTSSSLGPRGARLFSREQLIAVAALAPISGQLPRMTGGAIRRQLSPTALRTRWFEQLQILVRHMPSRGRSLVCLTPGMEPAALKVVSTPREAIPAFGGWVIDLSHIAAASGRAGACQ